METWIQLSIGIILIAAGTTIVAGCLSQRNFELINSKCPECEQRECEPIYFPVYPDEDESPEVVH